VFGFSNVRGGLPGGRWNWGLRRARFGMSLNPVGNRGDYLRFAHTRVGGHADHQLVDQVGSAPDDIEMPKSHRIEGAWINRDLHSSP
jgi:hypothetical protein